MAFVPLILLLPALAEEPAGRSRPADELLAAGLARAKDGGKRVFLLFGSPG